ncbi:hypothetical protein N7G274_004741 [Stereocaulon virgatum]|uniref:S-adenosyl-L-methionine-dependent methyltransferase n=1 Tax=Stereocaulon virgatum TaxID=373712 RepID=A0ABR4A993_9LECA
MVVNKPRLQVLLNDVSAYGRAFLEDDESARSALVTQARALLAELENPNETITWLAWAEPTRRAALEIAIAIGLFPQLTSPRTASQLSMTCKTSSRLMERLLRHLVATSVIVKSGPSSFAATPLSRALCDPTCSAALTWSSGLPAPVLARLPAYLAESRYREPQDPSKGPFQFAFNTDMTPWQWAATQKGLPQAFSQHMSGYHAERPSWMDEGFYPVRTRLGDGMKSRDNEVLIVDVGGGLGHDLEELKTKCPGLAAKGRLVLQELRQTARSAKMSRPWLEVIEHDFFKPQPIKNARTYYMHSVLHDWSDENCKRILRQLKAAMEPSYSKILINENVVPETGASWKMTSLDWIMMATGASAERTETQWRELITSVGLRVEGIWTKDPSCESLIEVTRDEVARL